jgi:hypothetical protein
MAAHSSSVSVSLLAVVPQSGTPTKRSSGHSSLAAKVPVSPKTGNKVVDSDNEARRECFMTIIDTLMDKPNHIWPLFAELQKRLREENKTIATVSADTFVTWGPSANGTKTS